MPSLALRTDEGTPITLRDLRGRALVIFLLGETFTSTAERSLDVLTEHIGHFMTLECSPVVVLGEPVERLAAYRERNDVPFLLLSDHGLALHERITGKETIGVGACIVDARGAVIDILPMLPPTELIRLTLDRLHRAPLPRGAAEEHKVGEQ